MDKPRKHFRRLTYEETERLINLIRENPFLYDQTKKEYRDRVLINNLYTQIATKMKIGLTGKKKLTCL